MVSGVEMVEKYNGENNIACCISSATGKYCSKKVFRHKTSSNLSYKLGPRLGPTVGCLRKQLLKITDEMRKDKKGKTYTNVLKPCGKSSPRSIGSAWGGKRVGKCM